MKKQTTTLSEVEVTIPQGLVKQGKTYYLQLPLKNYQALAQLHIGLLQSLQDLSKVETVKSNSIYWLSYIVEKSIFIENYEILDDFSKE